MGWLKQILTKGKHQGPKAHQPKIPTGKGDGKHRAVPEPRKSPEDKK